MAICGSRSRWMERALAVAMALVGCACQAFRGEGTSSDVGPRAGLQLNAGWQEMGTGVDQNGVGIYSEGAMGSTLSLVELGWGFQSGPATVEPQLYLGAGGGVIDNGRLIGIADAEYESWDGSAVGGGVAVRFTVTPDSRFRMGLDFEYVRFEGETTFKVDALPNLTHPYDVVTDRLELLAVFDYDAPHFRPFLGLGILSHLNELESRQIPGNTIEIESRNPFGGVVGLDWHHIGDTGIYASFELGYFGGPLFGLGAGYRF